MLKQKLLALTMASLLILTASGCSYREIDDAIQKEMKENTPEGGIDGYTSDGRAFNILEPIPKDSATYKGIGESFPAYAQYTDSEGELIETGIDGLEYTLNDVIVYDSITEAPITRDECMEVEEESLNGNSFILVDMTAKYTAPEQGEDEVIATTTDLTAIYMDGKGNDNFEERKSINNLPPYPIYFSAHPKKGDERLDYEHNYFSYIIKNGETLNFKLGILTGKEFIESKNIIIMVNGQDTYVEGYPYQYFDLFSKKSD